MFASRFGDITRRMRSSLSRRFFSFAWLGAIFANNPVAVAQPPIVQTYQRYVSSNGVTAVSYDAAARKYDTFLEHAYRFSSPSSDEACATGTETRDFAHDFYFGARLVSDKGSSGQWLTDAPVDEARYEPGSGVIYTSQHLGTARELRAETWGFAPMGLAQPVFVYVAKFTNLTVSAATLSPYALVNMQLGAAPGRDPGAAGEEVSFDAKRGVFYEYGPGVGTFAYLPLTATAHRSTSVGADSAYERLRALQDLNDVSATTGATVDVSPGFQFDELDLEPAQSVFVAFAIIFAPDEDAGPKVDALQTWRAGLQPEALVARELAQWEAWQSEGNLDALDSDARPLAEQSAAILRMSQVREAGAGTGQILASLPPGLGDVSAQWNIAWVRDMAYSTVALARSGHLTEALGAIRFQLRAPQGRYEATVGRPYRISVTRYFGNGAEESDCNENGPNIEFDGFGLFLWSMAEYVRAGGSIEELRSDWPAARDEVADVLVSLIESNNTIAADSSIWEVHTNGQEKHFTYTSLAAAKGLCDAAWLAEQFGEDNAGLLASGQRVRDGVVQAHTDSHGTLAQSAEDLVRGTGYLDAAAVEAINWGIVDPAGRVAAATLRAISNGLTVESGVGLMRNDDGGDYDSKEWVFVDLRTTLARSLLGDTAGANALAAWSVGHANANGLQFAELLDPVHGEYRGSIPMAGFGAGAYLLWALRPSTVDAACGAFAPEPAPPVPVDAGFEVDAGPPDAARPITCLGVRCGETSGGCDCRSVGAARSSGWLLGLVVGMYLLMRRRA